MKDRVQTACGCLIFFGVTGGFAVSVLLPVMGFGVVSGVVAACFSLVVVAAAAITLWRYHRQPDLAPDFLAKLARGKYAEADGLCFLVLAGVSGGVLQMRIHYQNRYDQPCLGELRFTPNRFFKAGLPEFGATIDCGGGEYGIVSIPWPVAKRFGGKRIHWTIHSKVNYPLGNGKALRFRMALAITSGRGTISLRVPKRFEERQDVPAPTRQVVWSMGPTAAVGFPVITSRKKTGD